jgi:hypothetical protein
MINKEITRQIRLEIAVRLCIENRGLYEKATNPRYTPVQAVKDDIKVSVLRELIRADPVVKNTLQFYYKREKW